MYLQPNMQNRVEQWKAQCLSKGNRSVIFAEGDSWFDYPFFEDRFPIPSPNNYDLLYHVSNNFVLTSMAHHGDDIAQMVSPNQMNMNIEYVKKVQSLGGRFKVALISGGGNDIVGDNGVKFNEILKSPSQPVSTDPKSYIQFADVPQSNGNPGINGYTSRLDSIVAGYQQYFDFVKNYLGDVPIIGHTYAYPFPTGKNYKAMGMFDGAGPWFKTHLMDKNVPENLWRAILIALIDEFAERLLTLESVVPNFHVVDFRPQLQDEAYWQNEMHPTHDGFEILGAEFVNVIGSWIDS